MAKNRKRIAKGELIASSAEFIDIHARRLIIEVRYNPLSFRVYKDIVIDTRTRDHVIAYRGREPFVIDKLKNPTI